MQIRTANSSDRNAIGQVHQNAFADDGITISELALALIADKTAQPLVNLVAEIDRHIVGNIIFSNVKIQGADNSRASILAPLAVTQAVQRQGIGRALVQEGLCRLRENGTQVVFVLGDPAYYSRYGFTHQHRVRAPYPLDYPDAWMAIALQETPLDSFNGECICADVLSNPDYW